MEKLITLIFIILMYSNLNAQDSLKIVETYPNDKASNVPLSKQSMLIKITFNKSVDLEKVKSAFQIKSVAKYPTQQYVINQLRITDDKKTVYYIDNINRFSFDWTFKPNSEYIISIDTIDIGIQNEKLSKKYEFNFRTDTIKVTESNVESILKSIYTKDFKIETTHPAYVYHENGTISVLHFKEACCIVDLYADGTYSKRKEYRPNVPKGTKKVLSVILDYGNTNISEIISEFENNQKIWNDNILNFSKKIGLDSTILKYEFTNIIVEGEKIDNPERTYDVMNYIETLGYERVPNDYKFENYDIFSTYNFDSHYKGYKGGNSAPSGSFTYQGVWFNYNNVDYLNISSAYLYELVGTTCNHEYGHLYGYEHEWNNYITWEWDENRRIVTEENQKEFRIIVHPTLLGWYDTDGDGIIEILDETPYGITAIPDITGDRFFNDYATNAVYNDLADDVKLFPNPASEKITIENKGEQMNSILSYEIYNIQGMCIEMKDLNNRRDINISHLKNGIYIIKLNTSKNKLMKKFIKK